MSLLIYEGYVQWCPKSLAPGHQHHRDLGGSPSNVSDHAILVASAAAFTARCG
jgi:hypothetical protein